MFGVCPLPFTQLHPMVQLTITSVVKTAIDEYCKQSRSSHDDENERSILELTTLAKTEIGGPIEHHDLVQISKYLVRVGQSEASDVDSRPYKHWRLDTLLRGASIYTAPPPLRKEPVSGLAPATRSTMLTIVPDGRLQGVDATVEKRRRTTPVRTYGQPTSAS